MTKCPTNPPYFDGLLQRLANDDEYSVKAFGRHVHWGYWHETPDSACSPTEYGTAAEELCRVVCDTAGIRDGQRILDVGCGFGGTIASLNERFTDLQMVGVNIDPRQLDRATELVQPCNKNSVHFVEADAANIPINNARFDVILAVECLFHFDRQGFFAEARRLLNQGGNLTLSDFIPSERATEYLDATDLSADEGIRWSYGEIDLSCSLSRYRQLADENGFELANAIDITEHTMPTYDFLYSSTAKWTDQKQIAMFKRATKMLEKLSRSGSMAYQVLNFVKL